MIQPLKDKITEVLDAHLNNYWNSVTNLKKSSIAEEIIKIISSNPPVSGNEMALPSDESIKEMSNKFAESMYFIEPKTSGKIGFQEGAKAMRDFVKRALEGNNR